MAYIRKRASGKYQLVVYTTDPQSGERKRHYKTIAAKNKYDAKKKATIFEAELQNNLFSYKNIIFAQFAQKWLDKRKSQLAAATIAAYKSKLNNHILPNIGGVKLKDLKPILFLDMYDKLGEKLASKTISNIHKLIHSILSDAVRWELLEYNVLDKVKTPKFKSRRDNYLSIEEAKELLDLIDKKDILNKYKLVINIALFCGLRNGEIMGLEWEDINFEENVFTINRTSQYVSETGVVITDPKTVESFRKVHFNDSVKKLLLKQKDIMNDLINVVPEWNNTDRVLYSENGNPMHPLTPTKWFTKFLKKNDFKHKITLHGLRHTSATIMIYNKIDLQTIASRLGHSDATTTLKIYSHQIKKADKTAADKIENTLK